MGRDLRLGTQCGHRLLAFFFIVMTGMEDSSFRLGQDCSVLRPLGKTSVKETETTPRSLEWIKTLFFYHFPAPQPRPFGKTFHFSLVGRMQSGRSPNYFPKPEPWLCSFPRGWFPSCIFSWEAWTSFATSMVNSSKLSCLSWFVSRSSMMSLMTFSRLFSFCG